MATKLYEVDPEGTTQFKMGHRAWGVDVPAYVYDLWMPLIGVTAAGVYAVYSRLGYERKIWGQGILELAAAMRIGPNTLGAINETLAECGFIEIEIPQGHQRKMHYTTRITVLQAPSAIAPALVEKYTVGGDATRYRTLVPWLTEEDQSNRYPAITRESNNHLVITDASNNHPVITDGVQLLDSNAKNDPLKVLNDPSKSATDFAEAQNPNAQGRESEKPAPNLNPSQLRGLDSGSQVDKSQETRTGEDQDAPQELRGLEKWIISVSPTARGSLPQTYRNRLEKPILWADKANNSHEGPCPLDLWDEKPEFQAYLKGEFWQRLQNTVAQITTKTIVGWIASARTYQYFYGSTNLSPDAPAAPAKEETREEYMMRVLEENKRLFGLS